jgi:uncharacterized protein (UPF0303 family)
VRVPYRILTDLGQHRVREQVILALGERCPGLEDDALLGEQLLVIGLLVERIRLHLIDRRDDLAELDEVDEPIGREVGHADRADAAVRLQLLHGPPLAVVVAEGLVDEVEVEVVEAELGHRGLERLEQVRSEAHLLDFPSLDRTTARRIGGAIAALGEREGLPITVAVHVGQQRVFHAAFEGTTAENDGWVERKRNTVLRSEVSSFEVALTTRPAGWSPDWLDPREFAVRSGAVPLRVGGLVVGTVALSGLVTSEEADHDVVMRGIREYLASDPND